MIDVIKFYEFLTNSLSVPEMIEVERELLADNEGQAILHALSSSYEVNRDLAAELLGEDEHENDRLEEGHHSTDIEISKIKSVMNKTSIYEFTSARKKEFETIVVDVKSKGEQDLVSYLSTKLGKPADVIEKDLEMIDKGLSEKFSFTLDQVAPEEIKHYLRKVKSDFASSNSAFYADVYTSLFEVKPGTTAKSAAELVGEIGRMSDDDVLDMIVTELGKGEVKGINDDQLDKFIEICKQNAHCDEEELRAIAISCYVLFSQKEKQVDARFIGQSVGTYDGLIKKVAETPETTRELILRYAKIALIYLSMVALVALTAYYTAFLVGGAILVAPEIAAACAMCGIPGFIGLLYFIVMVGLGLAAISMLWVLVLSACEGLLDIREDLNGPQTGLDKVDLVVRDASMSDDEENNEDEDEKDNDKNSSSESNN